MDILAYLKRQGLTTGGSLPAAAGVSAATLSRQVAASGGLIQRVGKARSAAYFATRDVNGVGRALPIFEMSGSGEISRVATVYFSYQQGCVVERSNGRVTQHASVPWFLEDVRPQGFLGRAFVRTHPELQLPPLTTWREDDVYRVLALHGEDLPGSLLVGNSAVERSQQLSVSTDGYEALAQRALMGDAAGSSAGGEQPKFTAFRDGVHRIVKFSVSQRRADLLVCEHLALHTLREHGLSASVSELTMGDRAYLDVTRFDRSAGGRLSMATMTYVSAEFAPVRTWSEVACRLRDEQRLSASDAVVVAKLDAFSRMIFNNDAHLGNMGLYWSIADDTFSVAPAYDVSPMLFAEVESPTLSKPVANAWTLEVWEEVRPMAKRFWERVRDDERVSDAFKQVAAVPALTLI